MLHRYSIKRGKHKAAGVNFGIHLSKSLKRKVEFASDCIYEKQNPDSEDLNKLFGFSLYPNHHKHSARIAWKPDFKNGRIQLYAYQYNYGQREFMFLGSVNVNKWCYIKITFKHDMAIYTCNEYETRLPFYLPKVRFGFRLFPYFGGQNKAPHMINIFFSKQLGWF